MPIVPTAAMIPSPHPRFARGGAVPWEDTPQRLRPGSPGTAQAPAMPGSVALSPRTIPRPTPISP